MVLALSTVSYSFLRLLLGLDPVADDLGQCAVTRRLDSTWARGFLWQ